jgi:hypothetical protein
VPLVKVCESCGQSYETTQPKQRRCPTCRPTFLAHARLNKYGISQPEVDWLFATQDGLCALCLDAQATAVDHDHITGRVRGLLCRPCNGALEAIEDPAWRARLAAYLATDHASWGVDHRRPHDAIPARRDGLFRCVGCGQLTPPSSPKSNRQRYCKTCVPDEAANQRRVKFGILTPAWEARRARYGDRCELCRKRPIRCVDHDHRTGLVRGLLCGRCNVILAFVDSPTGWYERALAYLESPGRRALKPRTGDHQEAASM